MFARQSRANGGQWLARGLTIAGMKKTRAHPRLTKGYSAPAGQATAESRPNRKPALATLDLVVAAFDDPDPPTTTRLRRALSPQCAPSTPSGSSPPVIRVLGIENDGSEDSVRDHLGESFSLQKAPSSHDACGAFDAETTANLINEVVATHEKLAYEASQDSLTGLLDRRGLQETLADEITRMRRTNSTLSAMLVDCDDFKGIDDTLGYAMGDTALGIVANTLRATLRPQDRVGRIGGDEFLVLLPATRPAEATLVGRRFLQELSALALSPGLRKRMLTVGVVVDRAPAEASTIEEVIAAVAAPLKAAKRRGKGPVAAGGIDVNDVSIDDANPISSILSDPRCLRVVAQSIVRMVDGVVVAHELRVRGPRGDLESPNVLFALASSANSLMTFDLDCLRASMAMRARLQFTTRCHVNVDPATLIGTPITTVLDIVGHERRPHELCIEVSEQRLAGSPMHLRNARIALRDQGIDVALDHVGFSHSSLEALIALEPDIVKIDRRFVRGLSRDAGKVRALRRLAAVVQGLGAEVIAEGVESFSDIDALRRIGIEFGQGYFWDTPSEIVAPSPTNAGRAL